MATSPDNLPEPPDATRVSALPAIVRDMAAKAQAALSVNLANVLAAKDDAAASAQEARDAAALVGAPADNVVESVVSNPNSLARQTLDAALVARELNPGGKARWNFAPITGAGGAQIYMDMREGWLAQGFTVGADGKTGNAAQIAPTLEIIPAYPAYRPDLEGTWGANIVDPVSCWQLYRLGRGNTADREYLYMEAFGNGERFQFGTHASGTGLNRPVEFKSKGVLSWTMRTDAVMEVGKRLYFPPTAQAAPFLMERTGTDPMLSLRQIGSNANVPMIFMSKARGVPGDVLPPGANTVLGDIRAGYDSSAGAYLGGAWRLEATEDWDPATKRGTRAIVRITPTGTTATETGLEIGHPFNSLETSAIVLVNLGGTVTAKRLLVGSADSAGAGFRTVRVAN